MTREIADRVPVDSPGAREIGFTIPQHYNASRILYDNLRHGRGAKPALIGPAGTRSYAELCAEASQWGHGFQSLADVERAVLEPGGTLTFSPKEPPVDARRHAELLARLDLLLARLER